jgi:hypothetical protein
MMEAVRTSEALVSFHQFARRYNPEDSHFHTYRRENLTSYISGVNLLALGHRRRRFVQTGLSGACALHRTEVAQNELTPATDSSDLRRVQ